MKTQTFLVSAFVTLSTLTFTSNAAFAFCGVIEESAIGKTVEKASQKAQQEARHKVRKLRSQYHSKLQVQEPLLACLGGAVAIDANGNQIVGKPSCRATISFCVNP